MLDESTRDENHPERDGPAWECPHVDGSLAAIRQTAVEVLLRPAESFRRMRVTGGTVRPLLFYAVMMLVSTALYSIVSSFTSGMVNSFINTLTGSHLPLRQGIGETVAASACMAVCFVPMVYVFSGVNHLFVMLVGAGKNGYEATFRVMAYTGGSIALLSWIPCVGLIAIVWASALQIIGIREAHETTTARAMIAFLIPLTLAFIVASALAAFWITMLGGTLGNFGEPFPTNEI
ncbi:MAG: YIP1 family protein [Candidatus Poribacteria bacterium]|nr:YIP1 family protein [Candidatus Poribacteria bacterium]